MVLRALMLATLWLAIAGASEADPQQADPAFFRAKASVSGWLASFDGELQTPAGGAKGTTSPHRPTTSEVGLDGVDVFLLADLELTFLEQHTIHLGYAALSQRGRATLGKALVSQGQTFPSNARVTSRLEMPIGRLGYRAHWLPLSVGGWSMAPEVGVTRLDFRYRLRSDTASGPVDRAYVLITGYLGFQLQGPIRPRLRGELDLFATPGISNISSIDSDLRLVFLIAKNEYISASAVVGLRGIWLRYKDDQKAEQNQIDVRSGAYSTDPWAGVHLGLRLSY